MATKITLFRDNDVKIVSEKHVDKLMSDGWSLSTEDSFNREEAIAKLKAAGLKVHHLTGDTRLAEMVKDL